MTENPQMKPPQDFTFKGYAWGGESPSNTAAQAVIYLVQYPVRRQHLLLQQRSWGCRHSFLFGLEVPQIRVTAPKM